jgi:hypothetical protein
MAWELTGNADATAASFLGSTNAQPLIVRTGPTPSATPPERLRVLTDGRIGIGTTTPQARLSVAGGGATLNGVAVGTDASGLNYHNEHETVGVTDPAYTLRLQSPSGLAFHAGPTGAALADNQRMTITPDGNVGVGRAPGATYKLDVAGVVNATDVHKNGTPLVSSQWADAAGGILYSGGNVGVGKAPAANYRLDVGGVLNANDVHKNGAPLVSSQWAGAAGGVISYSGGNVGIGTTTPQGKLQVSGGAIMPTIGNSATAGIQFPSDPGGGLYDQAFIRYFAESGETTKLLIGCQNDPDDRISFYQFGAERLTIYNGNVGIGTTSPGAKLEVNGDVALMGKHALRGSDNWLRLNQDGAFTAGVHTPGVFAPVSLNVGGLGGWGNPGSGNAWVAGSLGVGTAPEARLHVAGGDIRLEANRTFYSPGRLHVHGEEILYLLNKAGVIISRAWGGNGSLVVDGEVRLGAGDARVYIGGNQTGPFMQLHDDLWFSDPQNGTIQIRNYNDSNWGTMVGNFKAPSSIEYKKDASTLDETDLARLLDDTLGTDVVRYRYKGDDEASRLRLGVIAENCPDYLVGEDGKSLSTTEYTSMLHGAIKALADKLAALEGRLLPQP